MLLRSLHARVGAPLPLLRVGPPLSIRKLRRFVSGKELPYAPSILMSFTTGGDVQRAGLPAAQLSDALRRGFGLVLRFSSIRVVEVVRNPTAHNSRARAAPP